ncbi:MAG: OB-fold nucleic acid binding domain-containing protein [Patescibacteria group bacterium]|nr:OB-fold nucleic acid binding domain-containing protein [Patescibacteria group bacterium]
MKNLFISQTINKIGQEVELYGWVDSKRDHKKVVFIDLRDRSGVVQTVGNEKLKQLNTEDVVYIKGIVKKRPEKLINPKIKTGSIEIEVKEFKILAKAKPLAIPINSDGYEIDEDNRLKYRYLDLRRQRMKKNLMFRHRFFKAIRDFMDKQGFIEVETPILTKATPEGARDFIVPSRLQPGNFYALPQSPQQYKQLLMVAGIEKYYQIARCFRDEDPRADRAYGEFTQLDVEKSFTTQEEIRSLIEDLLKEVIEKIFPEKKIFKFPFPIITYQEAIKKYQSDRPDIRQKKDPNTLTFCWIIDFPCFEWKETENRWDATHHPFTSPKKEDLPLLEKGEYTKVRADQYDLVLNGFEVGGGSIRITDPTLQTKIFEIMGHTKKQVKEKFGHLLEAFSYGVPPHGGIALGLDRLVQVILNEPSVREVIAFPASSGGRTAVMNAPSLVEEEQLKELGIKIVK